MEQVLILCWLSCRITLHLRIRLLQNLPYLTSERTSEQGKIWGQLHFRGHPYLRGQLMGLKQVSFVEYISIAERSSLSWRVPYQKFHCSCLVCHLPCFLPLFFIHMASMVHCLFSSQEGLSALMMCCDEGNSEMAKLLLHYQANADLQQSVKFLILLRLIDNIMTSLLCNSGNWIHSSDVCLQGRSSGYSNSSHGTRS